MQTQQIHSGRTALLGRPHAQPRLRWPAWADRAADHPRACWTVAAACTAASLALLGVMVSGGLYPVTDWNGPRGLKPGHAAPTVATGRAH